MLRRTTSITAEGDRGRISAIAIHGSPCAEHEAGMSALVSDLGLKPWGYSFEQEWPGAHGSDGRATLARTRHAFGGIEADVLAVGRIAGLASRDPAALAGRVEEDLGALLRGSTDGLVAVADERDIVLIATTAEASRVLDMVEGCIERGRALFHFAPGRVAIADHGGLKPQPLEMARLGEDGHGHAGMGLGGGVRTFRVLEAEAATA